LSNTASLTQELTAAKSQIYEYQAAALKAANEARRLQERLAAARKRIANLQSQGRLAKAEAAELTEDLEGPKAKPGVVQRLVNGAAGNTPQATADMLNTIQTDVELERAARDAHALAGRIGSDLRAKPAEKKRHGWLSTALRRMAGMGPPSEPVAKPEPAPPQPKPAERSRGRARATSASVSRVAAKAP
jgi:chromosome segregation ATPase